MRLYPRAGQAVLVHDGQQYTADGDGGFDLPDPVGRHVHRFHVDGVPMWETDVEQQQRFIREDIARRRDPSSQYDLLERIAAQAPAPAPADERVEALLKRVAELEAAAQARGGQDEGTPAGDPDGTEPQQAKGSRSAARKE
jgi:hypothetical protein